MDEESLDDVLVIDIQTIKTSERKKQGKFISMKIFNQFIVKPTITWNHLPQECIYKIEKIYKQDDQQVSDLTNRDGHTISVFYQNL